MTAGGGVRVERVERLDETTAEAVRQIVERTAAHERHSAIGEHKFLRLRDGEQDTFGLVVRAEGIVAAYAHATRFPAIGHLPRRLAAELVVDLPYRGRGLGRLLLDELIDEARSERVARFDLWAHRAGAACAWLADSVGMYAGRALWQLSLQLDSVPRRLRRDPIPDGVSLRAFRPGADEDALVELIRASFPDHPENATWTRDDLDQRTSQAWFDPSAVLLAVASDGRLLGLHWMKLDDETQGGEVYLLGVAPGAQGHGLGRILLLEGLEEMRRRGIGLAYLYVEADNEAAISLYRQAGFRPEHRDTCYSLDLDVGTDAGARSGGR